MLKYVLTDVNRPDTIENLHSKDYWPWTVSHHYGKHYRAAVLNASMTYYRRLSAALSREDSVQRRQPRVLTSACVSQSVPRSAVSSSHRHQTGSWILTPPHTEYNIRNIAGRWEHNSKFTMIESTNIFYHPSGGRVVTLLYSQVKCVLLNQVSGWWAHRVATNHVIARDKHICPREWALINLVSCLIRCGH